MICYSGLCLSAALGLLGGKVAKLWSSLQTFPSIGGRVFTCIQFAQFPLRHERHLCYILTALGGPQTFNELHSLQVTGRDFASWAEFRLHTIGVPKMFPLSAAADVSDPNSKYTLLR